MIQPLGFIDTSTLTAMFILKHKERMTDGVLRLRDQGGDLTILKEWKSARAALQRIRNKAGEILKQPIELGGAFIETLPPQSGLPWTLGQEGFIRLRICLVSAPGSWTFSGTHNAQLAVGMVNLVENRVLCSELNLSEYARTHLVVDVERPSE